MYMTCTVYTDDVASDWIGLEWTINCWSVTQSGGKEISKIVVDWFLVVLETPKEKRGSGQ
jgi:hypothetical protein